MNDNLMFPQKKIIISFVLVYYRDYENTVKCIESILGLDCKGLIVHIVIVDNCSQDRLLERLRLYFKDIDCFFYIENMQNIGYAKGNNVGITYARDNLKSDFVVVLNTDIVIKQKNFCEKVLIEYEKEQFDVLGPMVNDYLSGKTVSPLYSSYMQNTRIILAKTRIKWWLWELNIAQFIDRNKMAMNKKQKKHPVDKYSCVCSGCCLVFSPHFFEKWKGFYPKTFLYREETILFYIINELGGKTLYSDNLEIWHKGGESTNKEFGNDIRRRNLFIYKHRIESLKEEIKIKKMKKEKLCSQI